MNTLENLIRKALSWKKRGVVLAAHGVSDNPIDPFLENVQMFKGDFIKVLDLLERLDFEFVDYNKMKNFILGKITPDKSWVHITLDDGYKNVLDVALPLLQERKIPFTLFVSTYHIETQIKIPSYYTRFLYKNKKSLEDVFYQQFESYEDCENYFLNETNIAEFSVIIKKMEDMMDESEKKQFLSMKNSDFLSVEELKKLSTFEGVTIASHSHHHVTFHLQQDEDDQKREIKTSFKRLKEWHIPYENSFCYPNGDYSPKTLKILDELSIDLAFASFPGIVDSKTSHLEIPRFWFGVYKKMLVIFTFVVLGKSFINFYVKLRGLGPRSA